jgi:hypothetical protein
MDTRGIPRIFRYAAAVMTLIACSRTHGERVDTLSTDGQGMVSPDVPFKPRWKDWVLAPIPISNPTIGSGLALGAMLLYELDETSRSSYTGFGGGYTDSDSWAVGGVSKAYRQGDRYTLSLAAAYGEINYDFFGIGNEAGEADRSIAIRQSGYGVVPEFRMEVAKNFSLGAGLRYAKIRTQLRELPDGSVVPPDAGAFDATISGPTLLASYDTRDREFSPSGGMFGELQIALPRESLGGDFSYEKVDASFNVYRRVGASAIVAGRARVCGASSAAPFFDLCLFGSDSDLRGFVGGQFRDSAMIAGQVEYRHSLSKRFGGVIFAGVGSVAGAMQDLFSAPALPAGGLGLRYLASPEEGVTLSIDYAVSESTEAWYVYVGDAF